MSSQSARYFENAPPRLACTQHGRDLAWRLALALGALRVIAEETSWPASQNYAKAVLAVIEEEEP